MKNKEIPYVFHGPFKEYCIKYVAYKRSLGFKVNASSFYLLRGMDDFFKKYNLSSDALIMTKDMVEAYIALRETENVKTQHMRMSLVRQFALFMNRIGLKFYVYPVTDFVQIKSDFVPYIFTHDEVFRLIDVLDKIPVSSRYPCYHIIYPMLFRMLYGCGLRINEALGLKMTDIDLKYGIIMLNDTKNHSQRLLPMSQSLQRYCLYYTRRMEFPEAYEGYFYPSYYGGQYNSTPVYCQFRKFMEQAGIFREDGRTPRVHDVRHTFSVHALEKMVSEGRDIYCALPILSTYLGHKGIESTEKYLRLTEAAYTSLINSMTDIYEHIFPKVAEDEK